MLGWGIIFRKKVVAVGGEPVKDAESVDEISRMGPVGWKKDEEWNSELEQDRGLCCPHCADRNRSGALLVAEGDRDKERVWCGWIRVGSDSYCDSKGF